MRLIHCLGKLSPTEVSYSRWKNGWSPHTVMRCTFCSSVSRASSTASTESDVSAVPAKDDLKNLNKIRNIGIMAHIDAGKTTTTERMLYYSGLTRTVGEVHYGDTVMDYMEQERKRGITITSAAITFPWKEHRINLVDTPGHVDFTMEVERSLRVLDGAVAIFDASAGVEAQSLTVWRQANSSKVPRLCYLNKMDKPKASVSMCLDSIKKKLHANPLLLQLPLIQNGNFIGVLDLVHMQKLKWDMKNKGNYGRSYSKEDIRSEKDEFWDQALLARCKLTDKLTDIDETIADYVLEQDSMENVPSQLLRQSIRNVTLKQEAVPVLMGSSFKNSGVQPLLDAIINYLPSPLDITHETVNLYAPSFCAMAFKIIHDKQFGGMLTFLRIYSGHLEQGQRVFNATNQETEKVGRVMIAFADDFKEIAKVKAGNIVVVTGLKGTRTGDTLIASQSVATRVQQSLQEKESSTPPLMGIEVPDPVFFCSVEAPSLSQTKALEQALEQLQREDPSLHVIIDQDTGQTVLSGMGELHLDIIQDRLLKEFKVEAELGPLQVSYKETTKNSSIHTIDVNKTIGDAKQKVKITLSLDSQPSQKFKSVILSRTKDNVENLNLISRPNMNAVNRGVQSALNNGLLLGFPVIDVQVGLHWLEVSRKTSETMVAAAAAQCIQQLLQKAECQLLEPYMVLEIVTDDLNSSSILADISRRRGNILQIFQRQEAKVINVECPLAELVGYSTALRTITSGTAVFSMEFSEYKLMSLYDQAKAIEKVTGLF